MTKAIEYQISGIKCDAEGCGYRDESVQLADYHKFLNAPCPKCRGNLLTEADLKATLAMIATCDWINSLGIPVSGESRKRIRMHLDGSGIPVPEIVES